MTSCFICLPCLRPAAGRELPQASSRINEYRIEKELGAGDFGTVNLAYKAHGGKRVAVKIFNMRKSTVADIDREVRLQRRVAHPNIVAVHDTIKATNSIYVVMEFASGGDLLAHVLEHDYLTEEETRRIFQQLMAAIAHCHNRAIAHRDVKLENLVLDGCGNVKVADFGFAAEMRSGIVQGLPKGSPYYGAPELLNTGVTKYRGAPADLYSSGVVLFTCLTGKFPFSAPSSASADREKLFRKVKAGKFTIPDHVSEGAARLVRRFIVVDPEQRATIFELAQYEWFMQDLDIDVFAERPSELKLDLPGKGLPLTQGLNLVREVVHVATHVL